MLAGIVTRTREPDIKSVVFSHMQALARKKRGWVTGRVECWVGVLNMSEVA